MKKVTDMSAVTPVCQQGSFTSELKELVRKVIRANENKGGGLPHTKVYFCSANCPTISTGFNLGAQSDLTQMQKAREILTNLFQGKVCREDLVSGVQCLSVEQALKLEDHLLDTFIGICKNNCKNFETLTINQQAALIDLAYNYPKAITDYHSSLQAALRVGDQQEIVNAFINNYGPQRLKPKFAGGVAEAGYKGLLKRRIRGASAFGEGYVKEALKQHPNFQLSSQEKLLDYFGNDLGYLCQSNQSSAQLANAQGSQAAGATIASSSSIASSADYDIYNTIQNALTSSNAEVQEAAKQTHEAFMAYKSGPNYNLHTDQDILEIIKSGDHRKLLFDNKTTRLGELIQKYDKMEKAMKTAQTASINNSQLVKIGQMQAASSMLGKVAQRANSAALVGTVVGLPISWIGGKILDKNAERAKQEWHDIKIILTKMLNIDEDVLQMVRDIEQIFLGSGNDDQYQTFMQMLANLLLACQRKTPANAGADYQKYQEMIEHINALKAACETANNSAKAVNAGRVVTGAASVAAGVGGALSVASTVAGVSATVTAGGTVGGGLVAASSTTAWILGVCPAAGPAAPFVAAGLFVAAAFFAWFGCRSGVRELREGFSTSSDERTMQSLRSKMHRQERINQAYQELELPASTVVNTTEVTRAYHRLAARYHPDKNSHPEAADKFRAIKEAADFLLSI